MKKVISLLLVVVFVCSAFVGCGWINDVIHGGKEPQCKLPEGVIETNVTDENGNLLTVAPKLPALKLVSNCYRQMFQDCSSLNSVECLATDISASNCTKYWLYGTYSTGNFYKNPEMNDWTYGDYGVPNNWNILDYKV